MAAGADFVLANTGVGFGVEDDPPSTGSTVATGGPNIGSGWRFIDGEKDDGEEDLVHVNWALACSERKDGFLIPPRIMTLPGPTIKR